MDGRKIGGEDLDELSAHGAPPPSARPYDSCVATPIGRLVLLGRLAWISVAATGFLTYLAINQIVHGDPLYFVEVQRTNWGMQLVPPWEPVQGAIEALLAGGTNYTFTFIYSGIAAGFIVALPLLVLAVGRLRLADVVYGWTGFLLIASASWLISLPRYLLVLHPLFVIGAWFTRSPRVFIPVVLAGAALQGWLMWLYTAGQWTF